MVNVLKKLWIRFLETPTFKDAILLCLFVVGITYQPFWFHHEIIMMETGIHLPAVNALFHGMVPYRDFFFLRGPLELYIPAFFIFLFHNNMIALPLFYYAGTVLTLLLCVVIAQRLLRTKIIFYLMIPVFVARTFPRISFYYWGGMRYMMGFLALVCLLTYFRTSRIRWVFLAGIVSSLTFLTTIESGVCSILAISSALIFSAIFRIQERKFVLNSFCWCFLGFLMVLMPHILYLIATKSFIPFLESNYIVLTRMTQTFLSAKGNCPDGIPEFFLSLLPNSRYFKIMTPFFCYLVFTVYLIRRFQQKKLEGIHAFLVGLTVYGFILYLAAFRKIEGHHFEMALQVEKFLLFFMIEEIIMFAYTAKNSFSLSWLKNKIIITPKQLKTFAYLFVCVLIISSLNYALARYSHRFPAFKLAEKYIFKKKVKGLSLLEDEETKRLSIERANGLVVPSWQEEEIKGVVEFLKTHTKPNEAIFSYPEVGNFSFFADRPFVGRFPIATFTWMYEPWHQELMADFKKMRPKYVIMTHLGDRTFPEKWYFRNRENIRRFNEFTSLILDNYRAVKSFSSVAIYERKPFL